MTFVFQYQGIEWRLSNSEVWSSEADISIDCSGMGGFDEVFKAIDERLARRHVLTLEALDTRISVLERWRLRCKDMQ